MASKILSKDQQNFMWISIACVDFIKLPLKDILDYQIKPADLFNRINSSSTHRTYYLRREQENICFIPPPGQPDYNDFDVTLLYTLIRNLCSVSLSLASLNPTKGWGKIPSSSHIRLGDDIERLRLMRNAFAHANSAGIPDAEFQVHWNELKSVIQRIQTFMNSMGSKVNYEQKLADIERTDFEFGDLQKYKLFLEATLNQLKEEKEKDEPAISITGADRVVWGGKTCFEADLKQKETFHWSISWQRVRGSVTNQIDISNEKYRDSTRTKLVIHSVCKDDEGEYQAVLTRDSNGNKRKMESNAIFLHVMGDEAAVSITGADIVLGGEKTCFYAHCNWIEKGIFHWSISWQRVRGSVTNQIDISNKKYRDSSSTQLVIHSVSKDDEGEYKAILARDSNGKKRKIESNAIFLQVVGETTTEPYRLEPITSEKLKDLFNSFNVEFPYDPLGESFVREILEDEFLEELVEAIHFLSDGIVLTTERSSVKVIVFEIDVVNDGDQFIKDEPPNMLEKFLNWEENNHTRIILITSKYLSVVQAKLIVFKKYEHVIKEKNIFLQHVFDEFDEAAKLVANQRLSSFSTFVKLVLRCFTTDLNEIFTKYTDEMLTPEKIKQLCLKVFDDVKHMGNERNWGQRVADFIHKKISGREELVCADALDKITKICLKTVEDLNIILMKLDEFQTNILPVDQNKQIEEWHKREVIRDILELQKYPSIIKYIAGRRDDNKEVVKVYLSEDNEDAKNVFVRCCKVSKDTIFEFVNVEKWKQSQKNDEIKGTERKPRSVDNSERKELLQIIRKYRKKIYARHSNVIGIRIGNVIQKRDLIQEKTCIILYCLDKTLIPFGEKPLPDSIEGWPCDVREDFFMLGTCPKNCPSTNKDFPELGCSIGMHSKNGSGSVGFLYESIKYGSGFLTASHVAIANCHELHVDNSLLSNHPLGKETHLIVHPSWSDNKKSNRTVGKVVESFYGEYKLSEELYEGLDFAAVKTDHCRVGDKDEMAVINTDDLTYTEMVKKTGRSTGTTYGYLDEDIMFATIEYPPLSGTMNDFPELYIVKDIPETPPFFRKGDSGSGVFVMGNQVKPLGIGIAFSEQSSETYVCKINEIVKRLGLTLVKYREGKQNQTSPDTQEKTANEITDMHI